MEERKNYAKIEFKNYNLDYDYCICEFHDIKNQLEAVDAAFHDADYLEFEEFGEPQIIITIECMTDSEYAKYLEICQEENN